MFEEEKLREEICKITERMYLRGLISSVGGNISAKLKDNNVLITPTGLDKMNLKPDDIVKVSLDMKVIGAGIPSSEAINHIEIYKAREDIKAIVHGHPPTAVGIISAGYIPRAITPEHTLLASDLIAVDFTTPGEDSIKELTEALKKCNITMLKNHGAFAVGASLMEAFLRIEVLEEASKMVFAGKLFGGMRELSKDDVNNIVLKYGKSKE